MLHFIACWLLLFHLALVSYTFKLEADPLRLLTDAVIKQNATALNDLLNYPDVIEFLASFSEAEFLMEGMAGVPDFDVHHFGLKVVHAVRAKDDRKIVALFTEANATAQKIQPFVPFIFNAIKDHNVTSFIFKMPALDVQYIFDHIVSKSISLKNPLFIVLASRDHRIRDLPFFWESVLKSLIRLDQLTLLDYLLDDAQAVPPNFRQGLLIRAAAFFGNIRVARRLRSKYNLDPLAYDFEAIKSACFQNQEIMVKVLTSGLSYEKASPVFKWMIDNDQLHSWEFMLTLDSYNMKSDILVVSRCCVRYAPIHILSKLIKNANIMIIDAVKFAFENLTHITDERIKLLLDSPLLKSFIRECHIKKVIFANRVELFHILINDRKMVLTLPILECAIQQLRPSILMVILDHIKTLKTLSDIMLLEQVRQWQSEGTDLTAEELEIKNIIEFYISYQRDGFRAIPDHVYGNLADALKYSKEGSSPHDFMLRKMANSFYSFSEKPFLLVMVTNGLRAGKDKRVLIKFLLVNSKLFNPHGLDKNDLRLIFDTLSSFEENRIQLQYVSPIFMSFLDQ